MTVNDLITAALKLIGAVAKSETVDADEQQDSFARLNDMLDAWAAESTSVYSVVRSINNLTAGKQTYTIGKSGVPDFNQVRPQIIQDAGIISTTSVPNFELPMRQLTVDEWASVTIKGVPSSLPYYLYYDLAYPLGTISLWPVPSVSSIQLALYVPTQISQFLTVNDTIVLPPGYAEAIRYNLAVRLAPEFGRPLDPTIAALASMSYATVQRANKRLDILGIDEALKGNQPGAYNWLTDQM